MLDSKMLVEQDPHQTRVAVLEDDRLAELYVERAAQRGAVGNVYKGRVHRVLPGMQAAFLDIGLERDAFLYVADVQDDEGELDEVEPPAPGEPRELPSIGDLLKPGQEVLVQVAKDPLPNKGARVTTHLTLPGRYVVLVPGGHHRGVSRRIEGPEERQRLRDALAELSLAGGLIARTAAEGKSREVLEQDGAVLAALWERIQHRAERAAAPALVHRELDLALRVVRDVLSPEFSVLWVDGEEMYEEIVEFLGEVQPLLLDRVRLFRQDRGLFEHFGIDAAIEEALRPKVWLKSGGYIVINPTEALVAIDVNTGRFVGGASLDETIRVTNLEAVEEIVRQVRLRNLGGILVIDLIDMAVPEHRQEVSAALERSLLRDRARYKVLSISEFGLVEITRKRSRPSLERQLTQACPYCEGRGRIKSWPTIALALRREVLRHAGGSVARELLLRLHPEVARALQQEERPVLDELERRLGVTLVLQGDPLLHPERFDILDV
ncbi:MAG TPA: Rne/Rng family ribonuclease [Thermoanaerobaculia bacterium]|nr:Rne/Rng family ribonuclease [Thermoanaerobaculia bacterium]